MPDYSQLSDQALLNTYLKTTGEKKSNLILNDHYNLLSMVNTANQDELSPSVVQRLQLLHTLILRYNQESLPEMGRLTGPKDLDQYLKTYFHGLDFEKSIIIGLNGNGYIIGVKLISIGSINSAVVDINRIVRWCLNYNVRGLIFAHNHPGGSSKPSPADIKTSNNLQQALKIIHVMLDDSVIISNHDHYSMAKHRDIE